MAKTEDLESEIEELEARTRELAETASLPRSKHPGLFRALRSSLAIPERKASVERALTLLAARVPDRILLGPVVELLRAEESLRPSFFAALEARTRAQDAWTIERQLPAFGPVSLASLEAVLDLTTETPKAEFPRETLFQIVETRLATSRRDRTSLEVTRGALRVLAGKQAKTPEATALAARVVEAETRRAGKEDPEVALAALDLLALAEPLPLLRAARKLQRRVERKAIQDRLAALGETATATLGASKEDVADLLMETSLTVDLDEGAVTFVFDVRGEAAPHPSPPPAARGEGVLRAASKLAGERREQARRLERALSQGRTWRLDLWRAIFTGNPLLHDLAKRLVWIALPEKIAFCDERDVFGAPVVGLSPASTVRLAHPVELDPDELALWRERVPELGRQPFPQLHRLVAKPTDTLERFVGRELHQEDMAELGKKRGYRGLPLRGDGPWELSRDFPAHGCVLAVTLDRIAAPLLQEKPRRDALKVFDDPEKKPRERREASPRARIAKVELVGTASEVARAEASLDLHSLTDPVEAGTDAFFGEWQKKKHKDPAQAWREAQLKMMRGSEAAVSVRSTLIHAFARDTRIEGRLAILGGEEGLYVDLGTGHAFEGRLRDWVPPWKLTERAPPVELDWPFSPEEDEDTANIVRTVVALARVLDSPPSKENV